MTATRRVDWNTPGNAEQYDRYVAAHPMYQVTSRALVALSDLGAARTIVDLCCGTGVTSEVVLEAAPHARVIALDASASQLALARSRITEPRASFVEALAEEVATIVAPRVDGVVCNAAVWQLKPAAIPAVSSLLGAGGRFAFNFPAPFAPEAVRAAAAAEGVAPPKVRFESSLERAMLDEARLRFGYSPPPRGSARIAGSSPAFEHGFFAALDHAGLEIVARTLAAIQISPEAALDWYLVPVFRTNVLPTMSAVDSEAVLRAAYARWRPCAEETTATWLNCLAVKKHATGGNEYPGRNP
ncbi:class I SAM-dependent methyltransferase [Sorangium sp. So ce204]|uniref:class I SAM-dependent methyltransferase n=1 Tax=Sorangium sp. So ce204 TaxID=3133288 RepID=UPI003F5EDB19